MPEILHYKTVFISDTHLWNPKNLSHKLLQFLNNIHTDNLIICWDLIDYWFLHAFWKLSNSDKEIITLINDLSKNWTNIIYIQWNHDSNLSCNNDIHFENITITKDLFYTTAKWNLFYITHWDCFDTVITKFTRFAKASSRLYSLWLYLENIFTWKRHSKNYKSIIDKMKIYVEMHRHNWIKRINQVFQLANKLNCDWIIMWHYHKPQHLIHDNVEYYNTWDRLYTWSALVETKKWEFKLIIAK